MAPGIQVTIAGYAAILLSRRRVEVRVHLLILCQCNKEAGGRKRKRKGGTKVKYRRSLCELTFWKCFFSYIIKLLDLTNVSKYHSDSLAPYSYL